MQVFNAIAQAVANNGQPDQEIERVRSRALIASGFMIFSGIIGVLSAWAAFFYGYLLAGSALWLGIMLMTHTTTYEAVLSSTCCINPRTVFDTCHTFCIVNLVGSVVGAVICGFAYLFYSSLGSSTLQLFAVVAFCGCVMCGISSAFAITACSTLDQRVKFLIPLPVPIVQAVQAGMSIMQPQQYQQQPVMYVQQQPQYNGMYMQQPTASPVYVQQQQQPQYGQAYPQAQPVYPVQQQQQYQYQQQQYPQQQQQYPQQQQQYPQQYQYNAPVHGQPVKQY